MTVKELKNKLKKCNDDDELVIIYGENGKINDYCDIFLINEKIKTQDLEIENSIFHTFKLEKVVNGIIRKIKIMNGYYYRDENGRRKIDNTKNPYLY